jgi:PAS domain S-box-containing protein
VTQATPAGALDPQIARLTSGASGGWLWSIADGRLYGDARFADLYGLPHAEVSAGVGTDQFFAAIHPEDRMRIRIAVAGVMHGADVFAKEFRLTSATGDIRWVSAAGGAQRDAQQRVLIFNGVLTDITAQKRLEERLRVAHTAGGVGTFEYVSGFGTVDVSHQFCRLLGLSPTDAVAVRAINATVAPGGPPLIQGGDAQVDGQMDYRECEIVRPDNGETRWIACRGEHRKDGPGGADRFIGAIHDITASKVAEARLRDLTATLEQRVDAAIAERKVFSDVIDGSTAAVTALDSDFRILAINRANIDAFDRAFGKRPRVGDDFFALFGDLPDHVEQQRAIWTRALAGEEFFVIEAFGDASLDRRWYEVRFSALRDLSGRVIGASSTSYDVTDKVHAEQQLEAAQEQLRQSQKMEAMGQLTGGVAHDFNNLLTPIIGSLDMLVRRQVGSERERRLIDGALQSAERAKTLVQRLLAFARRQPLQAVSVDLAQLIGNMADLVASTSGPHVEVRVDLEADLPPAVVDPNQLEMAILNLAVNARDAMPGGGVLSISARREVIYPGNDGGLRPGDYVRLSVADTGFGMDEATLARAVEPFFSTKGIGKGTGLGLSMVHGLAAQLGGELTIQSRVGKGATISLLLPAGVAQAVEVPTAPARIASRANLGTALLVDDEESVRMTTADMLLDLGYEIVEAGSGDEALRLIEQGLRPDLLVTDHLMPGLKGDELAREVRSRHPTLPILIIAGYAEADGLAADLPRLTKPFRNAELAEKLSAMGAFA